MPMSPAHRLIRRFAAWLAMLAMLLGALAPAAAQAVVASQGSDGWVQVCSTSGMVWVQADEGLEDPAAGKSQADAPRHCPWCSLQGSAGVPPPPASWVSIRLDSFEVSPARVESAVRSTAWPASLSRAPPLV